MTIYDLAQRRVMRNGMTDDQAERFLLQFGAGQGKDIGWDDTIPFLSQALAERIDFAAARWMNNPANAAKPAPGSVREFRDAKAPVSVRDFKDQKKLAPGDQEPEPPRAA